MPRRRGVAVVFHLHNFADDDARIFADADRVLVPTEYAWRLGLDCAALELPLRRDRVVAATPEPRHLTFVNPAPAKGLTVFARIALELLRRRPESLPPFPTHTAWSPTLAAAASNWSASKTGSPTRA